MDSGARSSQYRPAPRRMQTASIAASQRGSFMGKPLFVGPLLGTQDGFQRQAGPRQDIESLGAVIPQFLDNGLGEVTNVRTIREILPGTLHIEGRADVGEPQHRNSLGCFRLEMKIHTAR